MNAVRLTNVTKRFTRHLAVDELDLTVPAGSIYGFIGPNGSGKTTTLRMILHIIHADSGEIEVLGQKEQRAANDQIGYLPEERGLYRKLTVLRQLTYFGTLKGLSTKAARKAADDWLDRFQLTEWRNRKIETLSKGMAQKVQFIGAVLSKPELLILDEPFSGLDPVNLETLRQGILELNADGTTVIFSTHDMAMAERMCNFIFMILNGRKVLDGTLDAIAAEYGTDTIRLRINGGSAAMTDIAGVADMIDHGQFQEVRYDGDAQELLAKLVSRTTVHHFEIARPSLHDIFLRVGGPEAREEAETKQTAGESAAPVNEVEE